MDHPTVEELVYSLLQGLGEDPGRDGLRETPARVARAYEFLTRGYGQTAEEVVNGALFDVAYDEMVICRDIDYFSLCEHHLLPFFGKAHVAYIPDGKVVGLSKLARIVEVYARRLQVQERLTLEVAEALRDIVKPKGVAVVVEGYHLCMMMRGVQKQNSLTVTSAMLGEFKTNSKTRQEILMLLHGGRS